MTDAVSNFNQAFLQYEQVVQEETLDIALNQYAVGGEAEVAQSRARIEQARSAAEQAAVEAYDAAPSDAQGAGLGWRLNHRLEHRVEQGDAGGAIRTQRQIDFAREALKEQGVGLKGTLLSPAEDRRQDQTVLRSFEPRINSRIDQINSELASLDAQHIDRADPRVDSLLDERAMLRGQLASLLDQAGATRAPQPGPYEALVTLGDVRMVFPA